MGDNKVLIVSSGHDLKQHYVALEILNSGNSVFMPTTTQIQCTVDDLMAHMPTLHDLYASKYRKARIERARAKRRRNKR
jgi:hypothetical protein